MNRLIAVDIESYDPNLRTDGDGSCRMPGTPDDDGSTMMVVGTFDGEKYTPHYPGTQSWSELESIISDSSIDKVLHNGIYDLTWLCCRYGMVPRGLLHDTMTRMTYIDEYADLGLDDCCKYFGIEGKNNEGTIEDWYEQHKLEYFDAKTAKKTVYVNALEVWNKSEEFRRQMIIYNEQDCRITYALYHAQEPRLKNVYDAYMVDVKLTPLIIQMKKTGILIDKKAMADLTNTIQADIDRVETELKDVYGIDLETIASTKKLGTRLNEMGIHSPMLTKTGAESWGADCMARLMHYPVIPLIQEIKGYKKLLTTYLEGGMAKAVMSNGRIHCTFSPNKREDGGTVTGRFACKNPNLQQIPARDKPIGHNYGQAMRSLFLPEENCMIAALDYSQIEYLLLAHFAQGPQAEWFREQANAGVDFHTVAMQMTGIPSRQVVKTFNYGCIYGMGWQTAMEKNYVLFEKMAKEHSMTTEDYTKKVYSDYHSKLHVIRDTMDVIQKIAKFQGYVVTLGGRYQHKPRPQFDSLTGKMNDYMYKMLNKLIQGSAADVLKFALLRAYEAGIFNVLTMHLTVHDENVVSVPYNKEGLEAVLSFKEIMDNSFKAKLKVPMKACIECGENWGVWSDDMLKNMQAGKFDEQSKFWWGKNGKID